LSLGTRYPNDKTATHNTDTAKDSEQNLSLEEGQQNGTTALENSSAAYYKAAITLFG
jgi:hypothetical protein